MRAAECLAMGTAALRDADIPDPGRDARRLMAFALAVAPGRLTLVLPDPIDDTQRNAFMTLVARRAAHEPVSHLTGHREFYGRRFTVTPDVLDPRPETETLIEVALAEPFASVLDLGTGSGCILVTLLAERLSAVGHGTDISAKALIVAQGNATTLGVPGRAVWSQGDWVAPLPASDVFDVIVSNPPYIAVTEMADLSRDVRLFEPREALTDEGDGLSAYRMICAHAPRHLAPGGRLIVEIGPTQGAAVQALMTAAGLGDVRCISDLDGRDRVVMGRAGR